jgi:hypothetical protein
LCVAQGRGVLLAYGISARLFIEAGRE